MFRAFFSVPASIVGRDRKPVNAVHGYLDMTARLYDRFHPDDCVHVFDNDWRPAPRVAIYDGYKSTRQPDPEGLPEQFDLLREVLDAAGLAHAESPGWEGAGKVGATLRDSGDYRDAMRKIVPIRTDVDVDLTREAGDEDRLDELAKSHRLAGPLERLHRAIGA